MLHSRCEQRNPLRHHVSIHLRRWLRAGCLDRSSSVNCWTKLITSARSSDSRPFRASDTTAVWSSICREPRRNRSSTVHSSALLSCWRRYSVGTRVPRSQRLIASCYRLIISASLACVRPRARRNSAMVDPTRAAMAASCASSPESVDRVDIEHNGGVHSTRDEHPNWN